MNIREKLDLNYECRLLQVGKLHQWEVPTVFEVKFPWPKSMASCTKELFEVAALICIDTLAEDAAQEDDGMVLIVLKRLRCQPSGRAPRKESLVHEHGRKSIDSIQLATGK